MMVVIDCSVEKQVGFEGLLASADVADVAEFVVALRWALRWVLRSVGGP